MHSGRVDQCPVGRTYCARARVCVEGLRQSHVRDSLCCQCVFCAGACVCGMTVRRKLVGAGGGVCRGCFVWCLCDVLCVHVWRELCLQVAFNEGFRVAGRGESSGVCVACLTSAWHAERCRRFCLPRHQEGALAAARARRSNTLQGVLAPDGTVGTLEFCRTPCRLRRRFPGPEKLQASNTGQGEIRNRRSGIVPNYYRYLNVRSHFSRCDCWRSWRAHFRCGQQPPGNKSNHPGNHSEPSKK